MILSSTELVRMDIEQALYELTRRDIPQPAKRVRNAVRILERAVDHAADLDDPVQH